MGTNKNMIKKEDFLDNLSYLLRETFEGSPEGQGSAYLDRGVGVFATIEKISAETASRSIGENEAALAAHLEHARFYLIALVEFMNGRTEKVNWDESWSVKTVTESEWDLLKENVRRDYEKTAEAFQAIESWNDDNIGEAMAIVAHTAYHLGAIRQIMKAEK
ncbi:MAG: DinB family protein [Acidobacteria bacterium]|nr:DinB family protein [Acidobacteriota bacterium]